MLQNNLDTRSSTFLEVPFFGRLKEEHRGAVVDLIKDFEEILFPLFFEEISNSKSVFEILFDHKTGLPHNIVLKFDSVEEIQEEFFSEFQKTIESFSALMGQFFVNFKTNFFLNTNNRNKLLGLLEEEISERVCGEALEAVKRNSVFKEFSKAKPSVSDKKALDDKRKIE